MANETGPARIWLGPPCCANPDTGREWAADPHPWPCPDCECNGQGVAYVRADLAQRGAAAMQDDPVAYGGLADQLAGLAARLGDPGGWRAAEPFLTGLRQSVWDWHRTLERCGGKAEARHYVFALAILNVAAIRALGDTADDQHRIRAALADAVAELLRAPIMLPVAEECGEIPSMVRVRMQQRYPGPPNGA